MKKLAAVLFCTLFLTSFSFSIDLPFFSGYTGLLCDFTSNPEKDNSSYSPDLTAQAFFAGQLDFSGKLLLRTELFFETSNLMEDNMFLEPESNNSKFRIKEVSGTFKRDTLKNTQFISLFLGEYEPIGSDVFLQRQFGIQPITSRLTECWNGLSTSALYPFYGAGFSYVIHYELPLASGFYGYFSSENSSENTTSYSEAENLFNTDLRLAGVFNNLTFDFSAGVGYELDNSTETGNSVVLLINKLYFHTGTSILIGNRYNTSLFIQAGIQNKEIDPNSEDSKNLNTDELYILLEPRFKLRNCNINFSIFNIPNKSLMQMIYLKDTLIDDDSGKYLTDIDVSNKDNGAASTMGLGTTLYTDHLFIGNINFTFGIHAVYSLPGTTIADLKTDNLKDLFLSDTANFIVTPYLNLPLMNGTFTSSIQVSTLDLGDNSMSAAKFRIGYRTQL